MWEMPTCFHLSQDDPSLWSHLALPLFPPCLRLYWGQGLQVTLELREDRGRVGSPETRSSGARN